VEILGLHIKDKDIRQQVAKIAGYRGYRSSAETGGGFEDLSFVFFNWRGDSHTVISL
jgi:hypothetical protein